MSKYYAICGSHSLIVTADSPEQAAMRLLDEALAAHVWIYDDPDLSEQDRRDHLVLEALLHLDTCVTVSQRGLERCEEGHFEVPQLIEQWHRLMTGVSRLFVAAGLAPRRVLPPALTAVAAPELAR
ncbi:hypothetical protein [Roseimaritima ulvae]|uniref:Uncharacterized protein n=1 Tax=Roseimaritima ulvae TaxID=980254 RepID=A0A5B9QU68_9BACT|nr:hypothetical protein [Roseimaritima ulvae]QEG41499.1 hypothetical protein UC8_35220 [Roseimaritima ulvae]